MQRGNHGRWLVILPVILALVGLVFGDNLYERYTGHSIFAPSQKSLRDEPKTVVIIVTATAPAQAAQKGSNPAASACLSTPYISLRSDWNVLETRSVTKPNQVETYSHCPPAPKIRYVDLWVDDALDEVKLVCPDPTQNQDITEQFLLTRRDEVPHFESNSLSVPFGCRIDFTVRDTKGVNIQIGFRVVEAQ